MPGKMAPASDQIQPHGPIRNTTELFALLRTPAGANTIPAILTRRIEDRHQVRGFLPGRPEVDAMLKGTPRKPSAER